MQKHKNRIQSLVGPTDEEMAKKDDDHRPAPRVTTWGPVHFAPRRSARRLVVLVLLVVVIYVTSMLLRPPTAPEFRDHVPDFPTYHGSGLSHLDRVRPPSGPEPGPKGGGTDGLARPSSSAGPESRTSLSLPALSLTLKDMSTALGDGKENRNVLFASSSAKGAAALLPLACEMGRRRHNHVHYALLSRDDLPIQKLQEIHGIDSSCRIIFHDARPDYPSDSNDARVRAATERALDYINSHMHPQAVIVDGTRAEDPSFLTGVQLQAHRTKQPLIELPENGAERLGWLARLDSSSLSAWNKVDIEIILHAPPSGSGSLIRLLRSLQKADFAPFSVPRLALELPHPVDPPIERFLKDFSWPPKVGNHPANLQMLSLRRRLPGPNMDEYASVTRFLESAWPKDPEYSHILVLSPNVEVSPRFPHYLKYALLHYVYSATAIRQEWDQRLVGINLDIPTTYLNASEAFVPPSTASSPSPAFLWQAPSSNALLLTGRKWTELHALASRTIRLRRADAVPAAVLSDKAVSKTFPAWLEHLLRLCRLRGYVTLYPGANTAATLATAHRDLAPYPEEYLAEGPPFPPPPQKGREVVLGEDGLDVLHTLPNDGDLLPLESLPLLGWRGEETTLEAMDGEAEGYRGEVKAALGCTGDNGGDDSFCN